MMARHTWCTCPNQLPQFLEVLVQVSLRLYIYSSELCAYLWACSVVLLIWEKKLIENENSGYQGRGVTNPVYQSVPYEKKRQPKKPHVHDLHDYKTVDAWRHNHTSNADGPVIFWVLTATHMDRSAFCKLRQHEALWRCEFSTCSNSIGDGES